MNQQNTRLLTAIGLGIPLGQILVWILETFYLAEAIPSEVAMAIGTVLGGAIHAGVRLVQYFLNRSREHEASNDDDVIGIG